MAVAAESVKGEVLPPSLDSTADPPSLFDGTTRMYVSYICPYAQRTWIARNYKGLQEQIKLVPIDLQNRPSWYKEVYPTNKDPAGKQFAEELLSYSDIFNHISFKAFSSNEDLGKEVASSYDRIDDALSKFDDGPFFLGQFSLLDAAYAPFIERFQPLFTEVRSYDITKGRPKLALWIQELNKIEAYKQTQLDPQEILGALKKKLGIN